MKKSRVKLDSSCAVYLTISSFEQDNFDIDKIFDTYKKLGYPGDEYFFTSVIGDLISKGKSEFVEKSLSLMRRSGFEPSRGLLDLLVKI